MPDVTVASGLAMGPEYWTEGAELDPTGQHLRAGPVRGRLVAGEGPASSIVVLRIARSAPVVISADVVTPPSEQDVRGRWCHFNLKLQRRKALERIT